MGRLRIVKREARRGCQRIHCTKSAKWMPCMTLYHKKGGDQIKLEIPEMSCCNGHKDLDELQLLATTDLYDNAVASFKMRGLPAPKRNLTEVFYRIIV